MTGPTIDHDALLDELGAHLRTNGLQALLAGFNGAGAESATESWVGDGPNRPVTTGDVERALGRDDLGEMGRRLGAAPEQVAEALRYVIPGVVDALTPGGNLPDGATLHSVDLRELLG